MDENIDALVMVDSERDVETQTPLSIRIICVLLLVYGGIAVLINVIVASLILIISGGLGADEGQLVLSLLLSLVFTAPFALNIVAGVGLSMLRKWSIWLLGISWIAYIGFTVMIMIDPYGIDPISLGVLCIGLILNLIALLAAYRHRMLFT